MKGFTPCVSGNAATSKKINSLLAEAQTERYPRTVRERLAGHATLTICLSLKRIIIDVGERLHAAVITMRGDARHVISFRKANEKEVRRYEKQKG
jgi:hypothetical protein